MGSVISGLCLIWGGGEAWGALPLLLASPMVLSSVWSLERAWQGPGEQEVSG